MLRPRCRKREAMQRHRGKQTQGPASPWARLSDRAAAKARFQFGSSWRQWTSGSVILAARQRSACCNRKRKLHERSSKTECPFCPAQPPPGQSKPMSAQGWPPSSDESSQMSALSSKKRMLHVNVVMRSAESCHFHSQSLFQRGPKACRKVTISIPGKVPIPQQITPLRHKDTACHPRELLWSRSRNRWCPWLPNPAC